MGKPPESIAEARLAALARSQQGPFTREQALEAGFSPAAIRHRVDCGRWLRLHRGVFCDAGVPPLFAREISAAVLACGPAAAVSHRSAARRWDLDVPRPPLPEVTVPLPARTRPAGVLVHRSRLPPSARGGRWRRKLADPGRLLAYLDDPWCRARRGSRLLGELARERAGQGPSGSDLETRFLKLIRDAGLPPPVRQYPVVTPFGPRYLDLAYPEQKIALELDGMESRLDREVFLDERVRQNLIEAQGWTFRRFGHAHVSGDPFWTICTVGQALGLSPVRWR